MRSDLYALSLSAIFAALCYVLMLPLLGLYNVFLTLFICFAAGVLLGKKWGFLTGLLSMFLCSYFNPLGTPLPPIMLAQMLGAGLSGLLGGIMSGWVVRTAPSPAKSLTYALFGIATAVIYHVIVDIVDAWMWGPFWIRLQIGIVSSLVTVVSNTIIFILLGPAISLLRRSLRYQT